MSENVLPLVSVVLPVRDGEHVIAQAVESIRAQTLRDWELVVVDDGSRDGTRAVLERLASRECRLKIVEQGREGIVAALNTGLAAASGELIARMDADDVALPERLAAQAALLRDRPEIGVASCLVEFGGDRAASAGYALHVDWINRLIEPEDIALHRFVESPLAHPTALFRRELVVRHGGYRPGDFPEDYELWLRWLDAGVRFAKVPRLLLRWNDASARASRTDPRYDPEAFYRIKAAWLARELVRTAAGREIWVWGAGRPTRKRAAHLESAGVSIAGYIDIDPKKATPAIGGTGRPVIGFGALPPPGRIFVTSYVSSRGARELTERELRARGYAAGRDFLLCA